LLGFKKSGSKLAFCLRHDGVSMAMVNAEHKITHCEYIAFKTESLKDIQLSILEFVERYQLVGFPCHWVLYPGQYQLITTDNIDVAENELAQAIKWRVKGLIEYSIDDVTIDACIIPPHGINGQRNKVFVIAAQTSWLQTRLKIFEQSYLNVRKIIHADMAIRNLIMAKEILHGPFICFYLDASICKIIIYFANDLYLVRQLTLDFSSKKASSQVYNSIILELQRSSDYCVSELKLSPPVKLLVSPKVSTYHGLLARIKDEINIPIESIKLMDFSEDNYSLEAQVHGLLAAGCVLDYAPMPKESHATD
jgi:MSHA biogenesis protein MshI